MQRSADGGTGVRWWPAALAVLVVTGCGGMDGRIPVTGRVTLDGEPLAGVLVRFYASPETKGNGGYAIADSAGRFTATTLQGRPGIYPGDYAITLVYPDDSMEAKAEAAPSKIPGVYANPGSTPLKLAIAGPRAELDLQATSGTK